MYLWFKSSSTVYCITLYIFRVTYITWYCSNVVKVSLHCIFIYYNKNVFHIIPLLGYVKVFSYNNTYYVISLPWYKALIALFRIYPTPGNFINNISSRHKVNNMTLHLYNCYSDTYFVTNDNLNSLIILRKRIVE